MSEELQPAPQQAVANKPRTVYTMLEEMKPQIAAALPSHMTPERMTRVALTCIRQNKALQKADPVSLIGAIVVAAQLGLEPGIAGHAYLVPYGNQVTLIPGYRGLIELALRSGRIRSIEAHVVKANDEFRFSLGLTPELHHVPTGGDRGPTVAAWALARFADGGVQFDVMRVQDINAIRGRSKAGGSGPWVSDYDEMAKKTVTRRLCKYLPVSIELQTAISMDETGERGARQENHKVILPDYEIEDSPEEATPDNGKSRTEKLKDELSK